MVLKENWFLAGGTFTGKCEGKGLKESGLKRRLVKWSLVGGYIYRKMEGFHSFKKSSLKRRLVLGWGYVYRKLKRLSNWILKSCQPHRVT